MKPVLVSSRKKFRGERYLDITPSSLPWRIKGVLPTHGVAFLVGASKAGKSFLGLHIGLAIAAGAERVLGRRATPCGVVYIGAEDAMGCRGRIAAWRKVKRPTSDTPFDFYGDEVNLLDPEDVSDLIENLRESDARFDELDEKRLGLIVIDTLSRCIPGVDENNSQDMSRAFKTLKHIGNELNALVLVLAHFGKSGEERGIRGWSGLDANSDATITLEREKDDPELRTLTFSKVKNGVDGGKLSFTLEEVGLGIIDQDGEEICSCVCRFTEAPVTSRDMKRRAMTVPEKLAHDAIVFVTDHGSTQAPPPTVIGVKPWIKAVRRGDVLMQAWSSGFWTEGEKDNTARQRFGRALSGLQAAGRIRMEADLIWKL